jgi:cyclic pyranopterin phosphate synthase
MASDRIHVSEPRPPAPRAPLRDRLGRPLEDLRISVIDRCNFRCSFCMPAGRRYEFLPKSELLSFEEIARVARLFATLGVRKLRLTGGEPLLRVEIEKLVAMLAAIPGIEDLALTTNGVLLAQKARALREAGLRRVTVSLETLDDEVFGRLNGVGAKVGTVLEGIEAAQREGLGPVKVNAVVMRGVNDHEVVDLARFFEARGCVVRFIEYMDVGTVNGWRLEDVLSAREILDRVGAELPLEPLERSHPSDPALRFRYLRSGLEVGAIASITEPFCGDCTRARLSSDGAVYTCLFGAAGTDLKQPLRSGADDAELLELLSGLWSRRADRYSEARVERLREEEPLVALGRDPGTAAATARRVEMFRIGG